MPKQSHKTKMSLRKVKRGIYPLVTMKMNSMGHLEVWQGDNESGESDLYFQVDTDIEAVLEDLTQEERDELEGGWTIKTTNFNDEYFMEGRSLPKQQKGTWVKRAIPGEQYTVVNPDDVTAFDIAVYKDNGRYTLGSQRILPAGTILQVAGYQNNQGTNCRIPGTAIAVCVIDFDRSVGNGSLVASGLSDSFSTLSTRNTPITFTTPFDSPLGRLAVGTEAWVQGGYGGIAHVVIDNGNFAGQEFDMPALLLDEVSQVRSDTRIFMKKKAEWGKVKKVRRQTPMQRGSHFQIGDQAYVNTVDRQEIWLLQREGQTATVTSLTANSEYVTFQFEDGFEIDVPAQLADRNFQFVAGETRSIKGETTMPQPTKPSLRKALRKAIEPKPSVPAKRYRLSPAQQLAPTGKRAAAHPNDTQARAAMMAVSIHLPNTPMIPSDNER